MNIKEFIPLETDDRSGPDPADTGLGRFSGATDMAVGPMLACLDPGCDMLDLCCGPGNLSAAAHARGFRVTGIDASRELLAHAHDRAPGAVFFVGDAQQMPFDDGVFDAVTCGFGLMQLPDQTKALAEVARVLRPGGRFVLASWHGPDISPAFALLYGSVLAHGAAGVKRPDSRGAHRLARERSARMLFDKAGLTLDRFETVTCSWDLDDPAGVIDLFRTGAPHTGALLNGQPEENLQAIRNAIAGRVREDFARDTGWTVPMPAALAVGTRR